MTSATQRVQQGIRALLAFVTSVDLELAKQHLTNAEFEAFCQMARAEQLHSLNVLRDVLAQADTTPNTLAVAALLHDVGKSRYHLAVWQKTLAVLLKKFMPVVANRLSHRDKLTFWTAPFMVREHHPHWSADILTVCGSNKVAIWLVEHHQEDNQAYTDHQYHALLCRLQVADDAN